MEKITVPQQMLTIYLGNAYEDKDDLRDYLQNGFSPGVPRDGYELAFANHQKALEIYLELFGEEHPRVAASFRKLGSLYYSMYSDEGGPLYDLSLGNYQKALEIYLKVFGAEHKAVMNSYLNLAISYLNRGQDDLALENCLKVLETRLKVFDGEHVDVATSYYYIGLVYETKGQSDLALYNYRKAFAIRLRALGDEHPATKRIESLIDDLQTNVSSPNNAAAD